MGNPTVPMTLVPGSSEPERAAPDWICCPNCLGDRISNSVKCWRCEGRGQIKAPWAKKSEAPERSRAGQEDDAYDGPETHHWHCPICNGKWEVQGWTRATQGDCICPGCWQKRAVRLITRDDVSKKLFYWEPEPCADAKEAPDAE